jgi:hypothetical protein
MYDSNRVEGRQRTGQLLSVTHHGSDRHGLLLFHQAG